MHALVDFLAVHRYVLRRSESKAHLRAVYAEHCNRHVITNFHRLSQAPSEDQHVALRGDRAPGFFGYRPAPLPLWIGMLATASHGIGVIHVAAMRRPHLSAGNYPQVKARPLDCVAFAYRLSDICSPKSSIRALAKLVAFFAAVAPAQPATIHTPLYGN